MLPLRTLRTTRISLLLTIRYNRCCQAPVKKRMRTSIFWSLAAAADTTRPSTTLHTTIAAKTLSAVYTAQGSACAAQGKDCVCCRSCAGLAVDGGTRIDDVTQHTGRRGGQRWHRSLRCEYGRMQCVVRTLGTDLSRCMVVAESDAVLFRGYVAPRLLSSGAGSYTQCVHARLATRGDRLVHRGADHALLSE